MGYAQLNRSMMIAIASSIAVSALAAQLLAGQPDYLNTTYTLAVDYVVYFGVFGLLYYLGSRKKYAGEGRSQLRGDLVRLVTSLGIGEVAYTVARWVLQYELLVYGLDPYAASIAAQAASTAIYLAVINASAKATRLFGR